MTDYPHLEKLLTKMELYLEHKDDDHTVPSDDDPLLRVFVPMHLWEYPAPILTVEAVMDILRKIDDLEHRLDQPPQEPNLEPLTEP